MNHSGSVSVALVRGAVAGLGAVTAMTALMILVSRSALGSGQSLPEEIETGVARRLGIERWVGGWLGAIIAYSFQLTLGTFVGALFGGLQHWRRLRTFPFALWFGLGVYLLNSLVVGNLLLGILPPLWRQPQPLGLIRVLEHVFYGATLGALFHRG